MKIGIITFWESSDNYGQILQCFALQQQLIKMGHSPFLIKYIPLLKKDHISLLDVLWKLVKIYPVFRKIKRLYKTKQDNIFSLKNKQRKFDDFKDKYIITSGVIYHGLFEIQNNPPVADCYICGSDQIWGKLLDNSENQAYFLNFGRGDVKRISYAASFGRDTYPKELNIKLYDMLVRLDAVSVREQNGIDICTKIGIQAIHVLDPTLLLSVKEYISIIEYPKVACRYFYTYSINISSKADLYWEELLEYTSKIGLSSISTTSSGYIRGQEICLNTQYVYATIPQWLGYIQNAQFVVTTSFHGVAFCLLLHTNFIYIPLRGKYSKGNGRVFWLLKSLNLTEKIVTNKKMIKQCIENPINWNKVDNNLNSMKEFSVSFLMKNLCNCEVNSYNM